MNVEGDVEAKDADRWASGGLREAVSQHLPLAFLHAYTPSLRTRGARGDKDQKSTSEGNDPSEVKHYIFSSCQCQLETFEMLCKLQGADKLWTIRA